VASFESWVEKEELSYGLAPESPAVRPIIGGAREEYYRRAAFGLATLLEGELFLQGCRFWIVSPPGGRVGSIVEGIYFGGCPVQGAESFNKVLISATKRLRETKYGRCDIDGEAQVGEECP
jgi:hypothetical protein